MFRSGSTFVTSIFSSRSETKSKISLNLKDLKAKSIYLNTLSYLWNCCTYWSPLVPVWHGDPGGSSPGTPGCYWED